MTFLDGTLVLMAAIPTSRWCCDTKRSCNAASPVMHGLVLTPVTGWNPWESGRMTFWTPDAMSAVEGHPDRTRRQYPGWRARQSWTRVRCGSPWK